MSFEPAVADDLRAALEERIAQNFDFDSHAVRLEELREQFQHSFAMLPFNENCQDCNCVMYAFDFRMEEPSTPFGRFYANTDYLRWIIDQGHLVEALGATADGRLAVYWNGESVKHVGVVRAGGRIASKWGIGFLYEHGAWEVPSTYGDSLRYFVPIDHDQAYNLLEVFHARR